MTSSFVERFSLEVQRTGQVLISAQYVLSLIIYAPAGVCFLNVGWFCCFSADTGFINGILAPSLRFATRYEALLSGGILHSPSCKLTWRPYWQSKEKGISVTRDLYICVISIIWLFFVWYAAQTASSDEPFSTAAYSCFSGVQISLSLMS